MTPGARIPRPTKANRTSLSIVLLFLSWPVVLVHRYWNHRPPLKLNLIAFEKVEQDIQWYIKDTGDMLSITLILAAFFVAVKSTYLKLLVGSFLLISIIDIGHYWLYYKRNDYVIWLESFILVGTGVVMLLKHRRKL
jgi:hypothetical protein